MSLQISIGLKCRAPEHESTLSHLFDAWIVPHHRPPASNELLRFDHWALVQLGHDQTSATPRCFWDPSLALWTCRYRSWVCARPSPTIEHGSTPVHELPSPASASVKVSSQVVGLDWCCQPPFVSSPRRAAFASLALPRGLTYSQHHESESRPLLCSLGSEWPLQVHACFNPLCSALSHRISTSYPYASAARRRDSPAVKRQLHLSSPL